MRKPLLLPAIVLIALCFGNFLRVAYLVVTEPHVVNYTEGISLMSAHLVLRGESLYQDINSVPYLYYAYPPAHALLCAGLVWLFGNSLVPLRCLSIVSEIAILGILFSLLRTLRVPRAWSALAVAWLAGLLSVHKFHGLARVDMPMHACLLMACLLAFRVSLRPGEKSSFVGLSLLSGMAILFKTAAVFDLLWCAAYFIAIRKPRPVAGLALGGAIAGIVFLLLNQVTGGYFWLNTMTFQEYSGIDPSWLGTGPFTTLIRYYSPLLFVGPVALALSRRLHFMTWMWLGSWVWLFFSSMKAGADQNYSLAVLIWTSALVGALKADNSDEYFRLPGLRHGTPALLVLSLLIYILASNFNGHRTGCLGYMSIQRQNTTIREKLVRFMAGAKGPVLSEEPYFGTVHNKEVWLSDPFQLYLLERRGMFNPVALESACASGKVTHIIAGPRLLGMPSVYQCLRKYYVMVGGGPALDSGTVLRAYVHRDFQTAIGGEAQSGIPRRDSPPRIDPGR